MWALGTISSSQTLIGTSRSFVGQRQLEEFIKYRLVTGYDGQANKKVSDPLAKCTAPTFSNMFDIKKASDIKGKTVKADRSILPRIVIAYESGRRVDLEQLLQHELFPVSISIADMKDTLRTGQKSILMEELIKKIECPA